MTTKRKPLASVPLGHSKPRRAKRSVRTHIRIDPSYPFSDAVLEGNTLFISGRIGLDKSLKKVPDDINTEARNLMEDVKSVLHEAAMEMDDLVYVQVFCSDLSLWDRFNEVYCTYFTGELPARAFIGTSKLLFDAHFEIQGIAIKQTG